MKKRIRLAAIGILAVASMLGGCTGGEPDPAQEAADLKAEIAEEKKTLDTDFKVSYDGIKTADIKAGGCVHDPSILQVNDTYYIYGSHMTAAKSTDLRHWTMLADGYSGQNPIYGGMMHKKHVFDYSGNMFSEIATDDGGTHVWAPDVIYNKEQGLYYMYLCTSSTFNASNLCYATSKTPDGPFEWQGAMIYSGYNEAQLKKTDILDYVDKDYAKENYLKTDGTYNFEEYPNAIDPTVFYDENGRMWMVYGSWSGGIFLLEIDEKTGQVIHPKADPANNVDPYYGKRLIGGGHTSIEGPYIEYDAESGYYYLYVSYGSLVRTGGYQIRVLRSKTVDGDYVDMNGKAPLKGKGNPSYYGLKLSGNYMLPSLTKAYMATGHNSSLIASDGKKYIVHHTRFDNDTEYHEPRVHQYFLNEEGWPCMAPYATGGETINKSGYDKEKIIGEYYMINQEMTVNDDIAEPVKVVLTDKGHVIGEEIEGTWKVTDGTCYVHITYDEVEYSGVFCEMKDEADTPVMIFTAVGNNKSIWGVKY